MSKPTLPQTWKWVPLSNVCRVVSGGTPSRGVESYWKNGDIPWVTPTDITACAGRVLATTAESITRSGLDSCAAELLPAGTILMTSRATLGESRISTKEMSTNQGFKCLVPGPEIDGEYLYYQMLREKERYAIYGKGSTFLEVNKKDTEAFDIAVAPPKEQRRIAEVLSTVDNLVEKTEALITKQGAVRTGMMQDILHAPRKFYKALGDVSVKIQDGTHFSPKSQKGPFRYITSKNIRPGYMDLENCEWVSAKDHEGIFARCDVRKGDVLLTKDGANTGNACLNDLDEPFSLLSSVAFIRCDNRSLHNDFLLHYLLSPEGQQRLKDLMAGNAITRLTLTKIRAFDIPCPQADKQRGAADALNAINGEIRSLENQSQKYKLTKAGLMADLLSGQVVRKR